MSSILSHNTGLVSTRDHNSMSKSKSPIITAERKMYQYSTDIEVEGDRSDTAG